MRTDAKTAAFALIEHKEHTNVKPKNTICLWFDRDEAEEETEETGRPHRYAPFRSGR